VSRTDRWQILPPLSADEFAALKADIARHGVRVPVVIDVDSGEVVDGHHRIRAVTELGKRGIKVAYDRQTVRFADDDDRLRYVVGANLFRRHLTRQQRAEVAAVLRQRGWSLRRIGDTVGVNDKTVRNDLASIAELSAISLPERIERKGGGTYPSRRPTSPPSLFVRGDRDERRARAALAGFPVGGRTPSTLARAEEKARIAALARRRADALPERVNGRTWEVRTGDFRQVLAELPAKSVDAIVTDPPYDTAGMALYRDLSGFAARVLKQGRLLVAYCGKMDLPTLLGCLGEHLDYVWTAAVFLPGRHSIFRGRMIRGRWRPVALFSAGPYEPQRWIIDTLIAEGVGVKGPDDHYWQQTVGPFERLIEQVTNRGQLVLDPFVGGGTTGLACLATGRRFLGCDIDPGAVSLSVERLQAGESTDSPTVAAKGGRR